MRRKELRTIKEVIEAVGTERAMKIAGTRWSSTVRNWPQRRKLPARTYVAFNQILERQGLTAPADLWGMR